MFCYFYFFLLLLVFAQQIEAGAPRLERHKLQHGNIKVKSTLQPDPSWKDEISHCGLVINIPSHMNP